jgi:hypothetical protein
VRLSWISQALEAIIQAAQFIDDARFSNPLPSGRSKIGK